MLFYPNSTDWVDSASVLRTEWRIFRLQGDNDVLKWPGIAESLRTREENSIFGTTSRDYGSLTGNSHQDQSP